MENKLLETKLEHLLMTRNFNELTDEEKKYVLATFSEEEYHAYAYVLREAHVTLNPKQANVLPSPYIKAALNEAFNTRYGSGSGNNYAFLKIAATIIVLLGCIFIFYKVSRRDEHPLVSAKKKVLPVAQQKVDSRSLSISPQNQIIEKDILKADTNVSVTKNLVNPASEDIINDADLCKDVYATAPEDDIRSLITTLPCLDPMNASLIVRDDGRLHDLR